MLRGDGERVMSGALSGLGVDVGGSGVRVAGFRAAGEGRLALTRAHELGHDGRPLAEVLARGLEACAASLSAGSIPSLPIAIAAPGRKTADGRGIARARNLAAAPQLLDELELALGRRGLRAWALAEALVSDAHAALLGETVVVGGLLVGVERALFLGPGSGLAEAVLWGGLPRDVNGPRAADLAPLREEGVCADLEDETSLAGLSHRWRATARDGQRRALSIEAAAEGGDGNARALLERFAEALALLVDARAEDLADLGAPGEGEPPALLVRTRAGKFFANAAVQAIVVPVLRAAALRHGARLVVPERPSDPWAACAGALAVSQPGW